MLMRITWGKIIDGKWDEYARIWEKSARDTHGVKGLKGRWLVRDSENKSAGYSISHWESREDLDAYTATQQGRPENREMIACFTGQYVTTIGEICATDPA
jgi:heme-degrading monooxygenase HmoA